MTFKICFGGEINELCYGLTYSHSCSQENIIAVTKIRNTYGAIQSLIFPILRWQYCAFLYCSL